MEWVTSNMLNVAFGVVVGYIVILWLDVMIRNIQKKHPKKEKDVL